jgi:predicted acyltransferase
MEALPTNILPCYVCNIMHFRKALMATVAERNLSLDVLRGLTLALMIVVNTPGSWDALYAPLAHAAWHGHTPTDLVFPSFLFVVGGALRLSMKKFAGQSEARFLRTAVKRAALIFLCGFLLNWFPFVDGDLHLTAIGGTRIMGVLQRIGLCYLFAALVVRHGGVRGAIAFGTVTLLAYWWMLASFGDLTLQGNAPRALDLAVLGEAHLYHGEGIAFDPEGILSTLPAIVNVLAGYLAMTWLETRGRTACALRRMGAAAGACLLLAGAWDAVLPINKKLWTGSYVLLAVGYDLMLLALLVWLIDIRRHRRGVQFFVVFGRNPLFIYVLSEVAAIMLWRVQVHGAPLYEWLYRASLLAFVPRLASLVFALGFMLACWVVAWGMDRRGIYVRL